MGTWPDVMAGLLLQGRGIDAARGFCSLIGYKIDLITVGLRGALDLVWLALLIAALQPSSTSWPTGLAEELAPEYPQASYYRAGFSDQVAARSLNPLEHCQK